MRTLREALERLTARLRGARPAPAGTLLRGGYRRPWHEQLRDVGDTFARQWSRRPVRRATLAGALVVLLGGSAVTAWALMPRRVPDPLVDDLEDVLDFALLTEDFNRLPLAQRLALIKGLVERLKGMSGQDSALMAAFAAGIMGPAREQLRVNAERLAVDLWDDYARRYQDVGSADRAAFLDGAFIEFTKQMEDIAGVSDEKPDSQRLADGERQAQRDAQRAREQDSGLTDRRVNGFFGFMHERGSKVANPEQRGRMARFSRDMTRHLRGQDLDTGQPRDPAGQPQAPAAPAAPTPTPAPGGG